MSILASLAKAYERIPDAPPFGYSAEKVGFVIGLNADGTIAAVAPRGEAGARKKNIPAMLVPQPSKKSVNISPNFLWGNSAYVLGITAREDKKEKRLLEEHAAFVQYHLDALKGTNDAGLVALCRFLDSWTPAQFTQPLWPEDIKDQNVVFALESERRQDVYVHDRPAAKALWAELSAAGEKSDAICLVTGIQAPTARLHPAIKGVWGAQTSGASIVAFNQESFQSYGHEQGDNAPVSEAAAFKYTTALNALLSKGSRNRIQIGDASTVFWADTSDAAVAETAESTFGAMFSDIDETTQAGKVGDILKRIRNGQPLAEFAPELARGVRFYVLGLAPNAARLSIRFWFENDFGVLARSYQRFVSEMRIAPPPRDEYPTLWRYLAETAVLGKRENVPPNLAGEWMRAILTNTSYPLTLLATVLMRIRADGEVNALRVGILKSLLIRNFRKTEREAPVSLDPDNKNKGYLLGRLFAVYEQVQSAALGSKINATIKDKFYGAASAQPRKVFPLLDRGSANHLSKVGKQRPGYRVSLEKSIGSILEQMSPAGDPFPASLAAEDQALFGLGYYHQRSEFFKPKKNDTAVTEEAA
ncbi:MAG TPA: type I-C CRISPR-associated protein Cas8c/Csd1 [Pseudolabrys sp.]|nr:type I-C CRISPR-associated protein Cas8c/Csd1 [Pseudolabrys sp.]